MFYVRVKNTKTGTKKRPKQWRNNHRHRRLYRLYCPHCANLTLSLAIFITKDILDIDIEVGAEAIWIDQ